MLDLCLDVHGLVLDMQKGEVLDGGIGLPPLAAETGHHDDDHKISCRKAGSHTCLNS